MEEWRAQGWTDRLQRENNGMKTKEAGVWREGGTKGGWMEVGQEERLRREGDMWRDGRTWRKETATVRLQLLDLLYLHGCLPERRRLIKTKKKKTIPIAACVCSCSVVVIDSFSPEACSRAGDFVINRTWFNLTPPGRSSAAHFAVCSWTGTLACKSDTQGAKNFPTCQDIWWGFFFMSRE